MNFSFRLPSTAALRCSLLLVGFLSISLLNLRSAAAQQSWSRFEVGAADSVLHGDWQAQRSTRASKGSYFYSSQADASLELQFTGTQIRIGYLAYKNFGIFQIVIDEQPAGTLDSYATTSDYRVSTSYQVAAGNHRLRIQNSGTKNDASQGNIIALDYVEVLNVVAGNNAATAVSAESSSTAQQSEMPQLLLTVKSPKSGVASFVRVNADGTHLKRMPKVSGQIFNVSFSPQGTRMTYAVQGTGSAQDTLFLANVDGTSAKVVDDSTLGIYPALWSPDGNYFLYGLAAAPAATLVSADGKTKQDILNEIPQQTGYSLYQPLMAWSPNSASILAVGRKQDSQGVSSSIFFIINIHTRTFTQLPLNSVTGQIYSFGLLWSPNGKQVAFVVDPAPDSSDSHPFSLYLINVDGTRLHQLSSNIWPVTTYPPRVPISWSPDGEALAFIPGESQDIQNETGFLTLHINKIASDGSVQESTYSDLGILGSTVLWLPDHRLIFTGHNAGFIFDPNATGAERLTKFVDLPVGNFEHGSSSPLVSISPDGRWACFTIATQSGQGEYGVVNIETGQIINISRLNKIAPQNLDYEWLPSLRLAKVFQPTAAFTDTPAPTPSVTATNSPTATKPLTATPTATPTAAPTKIALANEIELDGKISLESGKDPSHVSIKLQLDEQVIETVTATGDGRFRLRITARGDATYALLAETPGFLPLQYHVKLRPGQQVQVPDGRLLAGDLNGDNTIDILDVVQIGIAFSLQQHVTNTADLDGNGLVDVQDLILLGQNLGLNGPQPWETQ